MENLKSLGNTFVEQTGCDNSCPEWLLVSILGYLEATVLQPQLASAEDLRLFGATCLEDCMTYITLHVDKVVKEDPQRSTMLSGFVRCAGELSCTIAQPCLIFISGSCIGFKSALCKLCITATSCSHLQATSKVHVACLFHMSSINGKNHCWILVTVTQCLQ